MKKILGYLQNYQTFLANAILFIVSVAIVAYLNPREAKFKYEFQKGKPWLYEDLVSPFDFAIIKTEEALETENEQFKANKTLFLRKDQSVAPRAGAQFESDFNRKWQSFKEREEYKEYIGLLSFKKKEKEEGLKLRLKEKGNKALTKVYKEGILEPINSDLAQTYGDIFLKVGEVNQAVAMDDFSSIKEASLQIEEFINNDLDPLGNAWLLGVVNANLEYNISFDEETTQKYLQSQLDHILPTQGKVQLGEIIIFKGNLVDDEKYDKLYSLKKAYEGSFSTKSSMYYIIAGQTLLICILFLVLFLMIYQLKRKVYSDISRMTFILLNILLTVVMGRIAMDYGVQYIYLAPFSILPIIIRSFFDTRFALFVHIIAILMVGFLVPNSFEFVFLQFVAGFFAIILVSNLYKRSQLFLTAAKIIGVYCISYLGLAIIQEGSFDQINLLTFAYFGGNGLLVILSFPLIYLQEKVFGFVSDVSLLELSDTNSSLLRELAQKAPGTFQHSLQVANLAEAAVLSIGGNALLARTGALYHDIGKMTSPMYFIENQRTGVNPHDELSFEESASIIIGHVKEGIKLAKKNNLPDMLVDFIRTHHGTTTVMYFYKQYIKNFPESEVDRSKFSYPGPKPFSKETAALMMADSVEAAARSISEPDHDKIDKLVEAIINHQMENGQFENAEITLKEIKDIKKIFKKMLMNIYHVRIQYPE
jgi:putative nucleotidyltransferase with HDIG domain